jgi:hypothetical protein
MSNCFFRVTFNVLKQLNEFSRRVNFVKEWKAKSNKIINRLIGARFNTIRFGVLGKSFDGRFSI